MLKSRRDLSGMLCRIEAVIELLRSKNPGEQEFFRSADEAFQDVLTQCSREDDDWLLNLIDQVCMRQCVPYRSGSGVIADYSSGRWCSMGWLASPRHATRIATPIMEHGCRA